MAILPNKIIGEFGKEIPTDHIPSTAQPKQGPQPIIIESYKQRLAKKKEEELTRIPKINLPRHRRGGRLVKLRRKLAALRNIINADPPPSWQRASEIWKEIDALEAQMATFKKNKV